MSIPTQPVPFHWQQVDQRLSGILQSKVSAEVRVLMTDDVGHIRFQNMHNGNSVTVPSQRLQMQRLRTEECAARLYEGYCEIWQTQRTPAELDARTVQYMLEPNPESSRIRIAAWEVITARARTRTLEAGIASTEARIKMAETSLNGMLTAETPAYRRANVEQSVSRLKEERKELRSSLDGWQLRLKVALCDAGEIETAQGASFRTAVREMPDKGRPWDASSTSGRTAWFQVRC